MMCRIRSTRNGKAIDFCLRARDNDCLCDLLRGLGFEYDAPSRSFLMNDRDFVRWISRGDRVAKVLDAYAIADGPTRLAVELVAGLCDGSADGMIDELETVLGLV